MHPVRHTDLNLFRVFDRVMTTEGISSAAERLDMTPAAVSQSIKRLSEIIGEPLFRRKGRGIVPTARALSLHREVREALHIVERSCLSVRTSTRRAVNGCFGSPAIQIWT